MTTLTLSTHGTAFVTFCPAVEPALGPIVAQILADLAHDGIPVECEERDWQPKKEGQCAS